MSLMVGVGVEGCTVMILYSLLQTLLPFDVGLTFNHKAKRMTGCIGIESRLQFETVIK